MKTLSSVLFPNIMAGPCMLYYVCLLTTTRMDWSKFWERMPDALAGICMYVLTKMAADQRLTKPAWPWSGG